MQMYMCARPSCCWAVLARPDARRIVARPRFCIGYDNWDHRPNVNTGVLFMDNRRLVELSFATRYARTHMEFLKSDFWASMRTKGWVFGDQMVMNFMAKQP